MTPLLLAGLLALAMVAPAAAAPRNVATLIGVDEIRMAAKPGSSTANCSNDGSTSGEFELTGWAVQGAQTAHLNTSTIPGGLSTSAVTSALQASFDAWSGAPQIDVETDGTARRQTANQQYDLLWGRTGGSSIAVTYTWLWSDGTIESDTVFNNRLPWFVAGSEGDGCIESQPRYEVTNIATHEFGHTYGLGHAADDRFETMYPFGFTGETLKASPENGDLAGIAAIY